MLFYRSLLVLPFIDGDECGILLSGHTDFFSFGSFDAMFSSFPAQLVLENTTGS